jgi:outer membrane protein assembly factor BamB
LAVLSLPAEAAGADKRDAVTSAERILGLAGTDGGMVVHLGCGNGELTAALHVNDRYTVHGLERDPGRVTRAREFIRSLGIYGPVSVDIFDGKSLPYADNLVNLLVAEDPGGVPRDEVMRVLAPGGVGLIDGKRTVKPWPQQIDQWTHHLHDAGGNAVAKDSVVGPPRHLQWTAGPLWARSHGWTPSVSAMVSAGGRLFYVCDETLTCVDGTVPSKWFVVARDAFSGVLLWKRPIPKWGSEVFSGTPDTGEGVASVGRFTMPSHIGKRLVAVDDTVYVTRGATAPVTALDAVTGNEKRVYRDTVNADEILCLDGRLIVSINPSRKPARAVLGQGEAPPGAPGKHVCAVDAKTGRVLWRKGPFVGIRAGQTQDPSGRLELAAGDGKVFILTTKTIECLRADSGERIWQIDRPALPADAVRRMGYAGMYEYLLTVMVYHDGVVLLAQPEPNTHHTYHTMPGTLYAFDAGDGQQMWKHAYGGWGHCTPPDVFVVGDTVWTHVNAETEFGSVWDKGFKARDSSKVDYRIQALDLRTGQLRRELPTKEVFNVGHHHRCYRNKITERFLMASRRGVEFVDLASGENQQHHWVRSGCLLGTLPCNGLLYVAPHPCGCYITAKLTGFNALSAESKGEGGRGKGEGGRLERGPAYTQPSTLNSQPSTLSAWPTYRHDGRRSGATEADVPAELAPRWTVRLAGRRSAVGTLSGVVVAENKVLVADVDGHTVHALDAADGEPVWQYTAGARVDSPPTIYKGLAIFGSADGRVYCLRASDGALVWRFRAAPEERRVTAFDQLESPWPVSGSVLMHEGKCWFAAGRSSYLDGGIRVFALDPATGKVHRQDTIYSLDPETGKMPPETSPNSMSGLLSDIPATDGSSVFIRQMNVSSAEKSSGKPGRRHLFSTAGYLDPSWFNRTFWRVGGVQTSGIMVLAGDVAYGVEIYPSRSRETVFKPGGQGYRLACYSLTQSAASPVPERAKRRSPDIVDPQDPHGAWEGRKGGVLAVFDAAGGKKLSEVKLDAPPVWDGMAATDGRLFVSTMSGNVICLADRR